MDSSLQTTTDIKIIVGEKTPQTFFVQQQLLENTSDYFVKALRNQHLSERPEPGVLRFPEDRVGEWKLLLFWMYKHELPAEVYHHDLFPAVRAWALGDRLCIPEFQNHVSTVTQDVYRTRRDFVQIMLVLIWSFRDENPGFALIKVAVQSSLAHSPMRKLMAEEIVADESNPPSKEELEELDGYNFLAQLMELQSEGAKES
ncbi:hypothetical protein LTR97_003542 [Elasticomyces elasticus]|uniref:BTB domain-containing protein n=1 Tax=Elasticomyces elasticus TaxID=574655 RepID=A0AAN7W7Q8_9PEZI|nr:hypothetical protein LTR97_003542 [Elasticomyces elasticus]